MREIQQKLSPNSGKIIELESIRGLAALLVVFFHMPKWNHLLSIGIINNGYLMVDLFFVLSGFVIYRAYENKISTKKDLIRFQFLRFGRLYPVHLLFLAVFICIELAKYIAQYKFGIQSPNTQPFRENNLTALLQQIFLVQAIGPTGNSATFNVPSWSISVEFFTYIIFGVVILVTQEKKDSLFLALALASLFLITTKYTFGFEDMVRCLAGFSIGCLTAFVIKKAHIIIPAYISLIVFSSIFLFLHFKVTNKFDIIIYFLASALIVSLVLSQGGLLKKILNLRVFVWLGSISYAIYMSHAAVEWAANQFVRVILKKPEIVMHDGSVPQLSELEALVAWGLVTAVVFVISELVCRFIEEPCREKSRYFAFRALN